MLHRLAQDEVTAPREVLLDPVFVLALFIRGILEQSEGAQGLSRDAALLGHELAAVIPLLRCCVKAVIEHG